MNSLQNIYFKIINPNNLIVSMTAIEFEDWLMMDRYYQRTEIPNIDDLRATLKILEENEMYERCAVVRDLIEISKLI